MPKNENKGDDMVDIMTYLHQYVLTVKHCDNLSGSQFIPSDQVQFHSILVGGDQLTAAIFDLLYHMGDMVSILFNKLFF